MDLSFSSNSTRENGMIKNTSKRRATSNEKCKTNPIPKHLEHINLLAAGIDIGATSHFVAVPESCSKEDITGDTGMRIIRTIINGKRDPVVLAKYRDPRCKSSLGWSSLL